MKLALRAVLTGAAVDLGSSTFVGGFASSLTAAVFGARGATHQEIYGVLFSSAFSAVLLCLGLVLNGVGGFVAASIANRQHIMFGAMSAIPCLALGLSVVLSPLPSYLPLWSVVTGWFLCIPSGMLGGYVARRHA